MCVFYMTLTVSVCVCVHFLFCCKWIKCSYHTIIICTILFRLNLCSWSHMQFIIQQTDIVFLLKQMAKLSYGRFWRLDCWAFIFLSLIRLFSFTIHHCIRRHSASMKCCFMWIYWSVQLTNTLWIRKQIFFQFDIVWSHIYTIEISNCP